MEDSRRRPPRAINIIRPSSPLFDAIRRQQQQQSTAGSLTSSSTWSSSSASSILSTEFPATAVGFIQTRPGSPFGSFRPASPGGWSFMGGKQASPLGPLSRMVTAAAAAAAAAPPPPHPPPVTTTVISTTTETIATNNAAVAAEADTEDDDDDYVDEMYSGDEDEDEDDFSSDEAPEVVARMRQGCTIMNGKGELVVVKKSPASIKTAAEPSDHARLGRKVYIYL
ncbi:hypothetical protein BX666DRAFT_1493852 [Dichotomocladium elegans]|nr:hypothetical protein BX666DRAFT_1493852 [Dichotomocladium elegans]